jgi:hypothetical protein
MKKLISILVLAFASLTTLAHAQTTVYAATGYGVCTSYQNRIPPTSTSLVCTAEVIDTSNVVRGYLTFNPFLDPEVNGVQSVNHGAVYTLDARGIQKETSTNISGTIDTNNKTIFLSFNDGSGYSGTLSVGYFIRPRRCPSPRSCSAAAVVITSGTATVSEPIQ